MEHESPFILQEEPDALLRYPQKQKQGAEQGNRTLKRNSKQAQETGQACTVPGQDQDQRHTQQAKQPDTP